MGGRSGVPGEFQAAESQGASSNGIALPVKNTIMTNHDHGLPRFNVQPKPIRLSTNKVGSAKPIAI
jgi:hypothetical protein